MLDPQLLRSDIDSVARRLASRSFTLDIAGFRAIEEERRTVQTRTEELQAARNQFAKRIGQSKAKGEDVAALMAESGRANAELTDLEKRLETIRNRLEDFMLGVPNLPNDSVPQGRSSEDNVEVRKVGTPRAFSFVPRDHVDIGARLKMLDFDAATKIAGARFALMKGPLARLHRAIAQFMLDVHTQEHGYTEIYAPYIANADSMRGTGQLPKLREDLFQVQKGGTVSLTDLSNPEKAREIATELFLIPTAEVPVT